MNKFLGQSQIAMAHSHRDKDRSIYWPVVLNDAYFPLIGYLSFTKVSKSNHNHQYQFCQALIILGNL